MMIHPPAIVREMTLSEADALLEAVAAERKRQSDLMVDLVKAMAGVG